MPSTTEPPRRAARRRICTPGECIFRGRCTEYCGLSHARMQMRVVALEQADYDAWVENQLQDAAEPTD